ncbi:protein of unknown function [Taphrina deformans PYCC 5710]|uniref:C3H1-type domain-containing protein n=1 Tax=Taphrina deformans (strain PYCC 5710 / ATCC 11124 / CBS 356.35 / IMI 108563 / JCM 9778 / NBRC 8474) TaxID=1097556 RepID=R4XL21_TAPDE|nr:protein of unknown function [Taphrina deformans PYCC 5710]|eukprot:CCG84014.1 protein of unknown function [Taphrina deformans PYCC 5710]
MHFPPAPALSQASNPLNTMPAQEASHPQSITQVNAHPNDQTIKYNSAGYALSTTYTPSAQTATQQAQTSSVVNFHGKSISLETEEDIAAWIAERKRKWPSTANVEKKLAEIKPTHDVRPKKKVKTHREPRQPKENRPVSVNTSIQPSNATEVLDQDPGTKVDPSTKDDMNTTRRLPSSSLDVALAALSRDVETETHDLEPVTNNDNEEMRKTENVQPAQAPIKAPEASDVSSDDGSDSSSVCSSDSSQNSSDDDMPVATSSKLAVTEVVTEQPTQNLASRPKRPCKYFRQGRCSRGDACTYSHDVNRSEARQKAPQKSTPRLDDRYKWRKRKSLYDRLVENELQQEKLMAESATKDATTSIVDTT